MEQNLEAMIIAIIDKRVAEILETHSNVRLINDEFIHEMHNIANTVSLSNIRAHESDFDHPDEAHIENKIDEYDFSDKIDEAMNDFDFEDKIKDVLINNISLSVQVD
jgi:hypothetical protein